MLSSRFDVVISRNFDLAKSIVALTFLRLRAYAARVFHFPR